MRARSPGEAKALEKKSALDVLFIFIRHCLDSQGDRASLVRWDEAARLASEFGLVHYLAQARIGFGGQGGARQYLHCAV